MLKRIFAIMCAVALLAFLSSCSEYNGQKEGGSADPKVVAAAVSQASKTADSLDNMNLKAFELGKLGMAMAEQGVAGASDTLDSALKLATQVRAQSNQAYAASLRQMSSGWGPKDHEAIDPLIERITNDSTRVWVIRSIAEGIAKLDKAKAMGILNQAAQDAQSIPDPKYRDLDLRGVSAALAELDFKAGMDAASKISDPRIRAWAYMEAGKTAKANGSGDAASAFSAAGDAAEAVLNMQPSSDLITDSTPPEVKAEVLAKEKGDLMAYSARVLANAALALKDSDAAKSQAMFSRAEEIASSIPQPYARSYAMSDVAMALSGANPADANAYASKIEHNDAKFAAMMKAATAGGSSNADNMSGVIETAQAISDPYDRAKALELTADTLVASDPKKAKELAGDEEYPAIKDAIYASLAASASKDGDKAFKKDFDEIDVPRFASAEAVYEQARAYYGAAKLKEQTDPAAAIKLYKRAASAAATAKSNALQWKIAVALCRLDPNLFISSAANLEGDDDVKAAYLSEIATDFSAKGDYRSPMVWDMAVKAASSVGDNAASADLLAKIASACAKYDKTRAADIFNKALQKAGKIGATES